MHDESRIVTAPDLDLSDRFRVLLVDCEWSDVERLSQTIKNFPEPVTLFLYGSKDTDDVWCLNQAQHSDAVLLNCRFAGEKEMLKGWLLRNNNCWVLGDNSMGKYVHRSTYDIYSWLIAQYDNYKKKREV